MPIVNESGQVNTEISIPQKGMGTAPVGEGRGHKIGEVPVKPVTGLREGQSLDGLLPDSRVLVSTLFE